MNISLLTREDIPSLERIEKQSFSTPWGEKFFLEELENKNSVFFIARSDCNGIVNHHQGSRCG